MRTRRLDLASLVVAVLAVLLAAVGSGGATAGAQIAPPTTTATRGPDDFAPLDAAGPDLTASERQLDAALDCPDLTEGDEAVLLIHGTAADSERTWGFGWRPALEDEGLAVCTVDLLGNGLADAQLSAERVVHAIRAIHASIDRPVHVLGYSQGGSSARFALRFWPDLRPMVDDLVLVATPIAGTVSLEALCATACAPAFWQFRLGSAFLAAVNSRALVLPRIDTTSIYTYFDQAVTPADQGQASTLPGAVNVAVQDLCPGDTSDHVRVGTVDPVAYALALDAFDHDGPADPDRVPRTVCAEAYLPGLDEGTATEGLDEVGDLATRAYQGAALTASEPELRCHVTATCAGAAATSGAPVGSDRASGTTTWWRAGALVLLVGGSAASAVGVVRHRRQLARRRGV